MLIIFVAKPLKYASIIGQYPFCTYIYIYIFSCFFFGVAQAFKRRFCSGICYFLVFRLPIMLRFGGSNMLQRGDYAREICCFVVVHTCSFSLQPTCMYYLLLISGLFTLALTGDIAFFFTAFTMLCSTHVCVYACSLCMYVKYLVYICVHTTPRHVPHFVGDGEIN